MGLSVRELKAELTSRGIDFSHCCEKFELQQLLDSTCSKAPEVEQCLEPKNSASSNANVKDENFAALSSNGRCCWVEFVDGDDALCHWGDGKDSITPASELSYICRDDVRLAFNFQGTFEKARAEAFGNGKLLISLVCSAEWPRRGCKNESVQALALATEEVAALIEENAIFWRGSPSDLREHHVTQLAPKGPPSLAMVLPLAVDAMRVLSHHEAFTSESVVNSFVEALEAIENHREAANARLLCEDALLRQQQDEEFAESLAVDQSSAVAQADDSPALKRMDMPAVDTNSADSHECIEGSHNKTDSNHLSKKRRLLADEFVSSTPALLPGSMTARLALRLSSGERVERTFGSTELFSRVRDWVECCEHLPEARDRELHIPSQFELAIAMPPRKFASDEDQKSLMELGLVPSAALLVIETNTS